MNFLEENRLNTQIDNSQECQNISSDDSNKSYIEKYIHDVIEPSESIETYNGLKLKPSLKYSEYNDEDWEKVKAIVATPDASKVMCIQSTYSYSFHIYNSPKHGLVEITESFWNQSVSSVTSISYEYLVENFRPQEIKMTFNRYLCSITSGYTDAFMTNPDLVISEAINALVESKKNEIQSFYQKDDSYDFDETPESYLLSLYIKLGSIDVVDSLLHSAPSDRKEAKSDVQYFVTKTKIISDKYDKDTKFLVLFAQMDENTFVSTHLEDRKSVV